MRSISQRVCRVRMSAVSPASSRRPAAYSATGRSNRNRAAALDRSRWRSATCRPAGQAARRCRRPPGRRRRTPCRGVEREPAGEHRQSGQQPALVVEQQVVAPVDSGVHRLLSLRATAERGADQAEPVGPADRRAAAPRTLGARGGQLDGQRETVDIGADRGDCWRRRHRRARTPRPSPRRGWRTVPSPRRAPSGSNTRTRSPETPSGSRLVARIATPGHDRTIEDASAAASSRTCSQLSRTISSSVVASPVVNQSMVSSAAA